MEKFDCWYLLEIAESANPPDNWDDHIWTEKEFDAKDGWKVSFFYDGDELDYIDHFVTPDGKKIDFWDWPEETPGRQNLINWRGVGDLERLRSV